MTAPSGQSPFDTSLDRNKAKSRVSAGYFEAICAQAGFSISENRPDADALARDATVALPAGNVHVQLKCTEKELSANGLRVQIKPSWYEKWSRLCQPLYIVGLKLENSHDKWAEVFPGNEQTLMNAVVYWEKFDRSVHEKSILLPRQNFLSHHTLQQWSDDLDNEYGGAV